MQRRESYKGKLIVCVHKAKLLIPSLPALSQRRLPLSTLCIENRPCPVLALRPSRGTVRERATWHGAIVDNMQQLVDNMQQVVIVDDYRLVLSPVP